MDYEKNGLMDLLNQRGNGESGIVNMIAFNMMQNKISGWPAGGKPKTSNTDYYTNSKATK